METIDFKISEIPDLDEHGQEALSVAYDHIKAVPSDKTRKIVLTISVDPETLRLYSEMEIRLPKADTTKWILASLQGIRENGTIRIEKPVQAGLFEGSK